MTDQSISRLMASRRTVIDTLQLLDRSRRSRFLTVAFAIWRRLGGPEIYKWLALLVSAADGAKVCS
jgi:hypothetical protein